MRMKLVSSLMRQLLQKNKTKHWLISVLGGAGTSPNNFLPCNFYTDSKMKLKPNSPQKVQLILKIICDPSSSKIHQIVWNQKKN